MSKENVVRRDPKNNRRKNTDGYRTDSGCFEDVDLQMANQHSPTSTSSESVIVENDDVTVDPSLEESRLMTENADPSPNSTSLVDECADDKDFHAILKRLSDITSNSGDLYRLCFNSRLSFCGHIPGSNENDESLSRTEEMDKSDCRIGEQSNGCTTCEIRNEKPLEDEAKCTKRSSHGQQCVELLSLLSSVMVKAKEDPGVINQSTLGSSLVTQLTSLLSTLEEAKKSENQSVKAREPNSCNSLQPKPELPSPNQDCNALSASNVAGYTTSSSSSDSSTVPGKSDLTSPQDLYTRRNDGESIQQIKKNGLLSNESEDIGKQPSHPSEMDKLEMQQVVTNSNTNFEMNDNNTTPKGLPETQNKPPLPLSNAEPKPTLAASYPEASLVASCLNPDLPVSPTLTDPLTNPDEKPLLHQNEVVMPPSTLESFDTTTRTDRPDPRIQDPSDKQGECSSIISHIEDGDANSKLNAARDKSSTSSSADAGDVVTNGRRAVKPYSWDYGDIWEEELERARNAESLENDGKASYLPSRNYTDMMPSFEEIRDDLFQNAGFVNNNGGRHDNSKRRSRSADARSNLEDESVWPEYRSAHSADLHSPFVRTIHQDEGRPSSGLTRSWSSHHIGGNSVTVNVDWSHGRQMRVITGEADRGFDDVRAQIIKEAVVRTSTFRGPKPWSVLKRRPSGLRRRSMKRESFRSNKSDESRGKTDNDSESSGDSPYISATSSDCLTMTTDESSSVTSSQYYAASSLPSSPSVSNRNSACFSDTSTSDASDIRRVVYQRPSSDSAHRQHYTYGYDVSTTRGMTLDQRFGFMEKHNRVLLNDGIRNASTKNCKIPFLGADNFHSKDSKYLQGQSSTLPRKWQGDPLVSPLFARSDPDLNRLTKVQFVGDSYSRSRISKNVRYTRNRSHSPPRLGPPSAHTRVVSCEIVQSDDRKRDVYTKVNISESLKDEEAMKIRVGQNTKLGYPSTRQSWHGQSSTRGPARYSPTNKTITPDASFRHSFSSRTKQQQQQVILPPRGIQLEKPLHAKLVAVNNHERMRGNWSTGSLRMPASARPRLLSDTVVMNNRNHGYSSTNHNVHENFQNNFNGNLSRSVVGKAQGTDVRTASERRRPPPDYLTAIKHSQGLRRQGNSAYFPVAKNHLANKNERFSTGSRSPTERNRFHTQPKDPMSHIMKETSFVGPSILTRYQPSPNPPSTRPRRSRSLNEKDAMSRRRLIHDCEFYRRRAMDNNQSEGKNLSRCDSNAAAVVHRSERRRRYSEGATRRATKHDVSSPDGMVDISYCDPRRESIREGAYSIVNAESARGRARSDDSRLPSQFQSRRHDPLTVGENGEKTAPQNVRETRIPQTQATRTMSQQAKKNKESSPNSFLQVTDENVKEHSHAGSTQKTIKNSKSQPRSDKAGSTSVDKNIKILEVNGVVEVNDFVDKNGQQKKSSECENKPMRHFKPDENSRINIEEENQSSDLPYQTMDKENMEVVLCKESAYRNKTESKGVISRNWPSEKINNTRTLVPPVCTVTDDVSYSGVFTELSFNDGGKGKRTAGLPLSTESTHDYNDKTKVERDMAGEVIFATELQQVHQKYKSNNTVSHQGEFFPEQVDEIDGLASDELIAEKRSFIPAAGTPSSAKRNTVDLNERVPHQEKDDSSIIHSPILPNRQADDKLNEVNVFIDYRNKRPVSVEYSEEDVSFLQTLGSSARSARRDKRVESKVKTGGNASCAVLDGDVSNQPELIVTNEEGVNYSRLSRKDRHEQEVLTNRVKTLQSERYQNMQVSKHQRSPEPYRRDSTIIYTDARTSFGSDTDSISRDSTVSSSGSDMTAILQEEMDISVDDLKQLTESGSKIGIDIAAIHVGNSNELLHVADHVPDELPPAMELSKPFTHYQNRVATDAIRNPELLVTGEAPNLKENATFEHTRKDNTLKRLIDAKNNESLSADNLLSSSYNMQSSCSSIASSRASSKSTGTESFKGRNSSKNNGKGFLSKLKGFRNSFRVKKSESISSGKKEKIKECESTYGGNEEISRRFPSNTDANANVLAKPRNRTRSETGVVQIQGTQAISRRSYDAFRHPNHNLRNVVGVKSVSSEHLSAYRINSTPNMNAIAARSLDVLAETCI